MAALDRHVRGAGKQLSVVRVPWVQLSTWAGEQLPSTDGDGFPLVVLD